MDVLVQMRAKYENPEAMSDLQKKLTGTIMENFVTQA